MAKETIELGRNDWGNLYRRVVHRRIRDLEGFVISDMGEMQAIADAEDGCPILSPTAEWVGYGSPAHAATLTKEDAE